MLSKSEARPIPIPVTRLAFFVGDLRFVRPLGLLDVDLFRFLVVAFRFLAIFDTFRFGFGSAADRLLTTFFCFLGFRSAAGRLALPTAPRTCSPIIGATNAPATAAVGISDPFQS